MYKDYRPVIKFKYKNNYYQMLIDNDNKMFFLKINSNNSFSYVTIEELMIFYQKFGNTSTPLAKMIRKNKTEKEKKFRFIPKVIVRGIALLLTTATLLTGCSFLKNSTKNSSYSIGQDSSYSDTYAQKTPIDEDTYDIGEQISVSDEGVTVETYDANEYSRYISIYDMKYLDKVLDYSTISVESLDEIIETNNGIGSTYKPYLHDFVNRVSSKYSDVDLRVLYENLKTLEIVECSKEDLIVQTMSWDSYGCYKVSENKIYVLEGNTYTEGTWEFQVLYHELCHMMRSANWKFNDKEVRVRSSEYVANEVITDEALNSIFAVSLFNYNENDIAYQLQSNYFSIMLESMDNYTLSDYINHSTSYFAHQLDEQNGDNNYATVMFKAIEAQYNDYHDDDIEVEQSEYYKIYDYIADMYFSKNITSDMPYDDALLVANQLVERVTFDVPEEYNIDINHFYEYFQSYCDSIGISQSKNM